MFYCGREYKMIEKGIYLGLDDNNLLVSKVVNYKLHPDNLISKGMPPEFIKQTTEEMSSINSAYDRIQKQRAMN